ncbi:MAG: CaiB/BaiF CoA transferase family protein [Tepidiformaceae bacterium]
MLSGYRVLDLTDEGALFCGQILGDLGADVVVVEPPGGARLRASGPFAGDVAEPGRSLPWWALNRNKRSVTIDLGTEGGREQLRALASSADFLLESFPPGRMAEMGLGYQALAAANPGLIHVSITPFGSTGPKAGWAATDFTAVAASGVLRLTGDDDRPPVRVSIPQAFLHAGADAAVGALAALAARQRDGLGQHVDASAQASTMLTTQTSILTSAWGEPEVQRIAGGVQLGPLRLRFVYPCKDGHCSVTFLFGTVIGPFTRRLMEWMHAEGFADEATRDKDWIAYAAQLLSGEEPLSELERCTQLLASFVATKTKQELVQEARRRTLLIVPVSTAADVAGSRQLAAREYWADIEHPELGRTVRYAGAFAKFSGAPLSPRRRPPLPGEHSREVFAEWSGAQRPPTARAANSAPRPALEGVKIVDFTWVVAGPFGLRPLADFGASVIHIESATRVDAIRTYAPFKDGVPGLERSAQYANVNAGKLGLTLNLAKPEAREVVRRLATWADIVVENYSPKAMKNWGLGYEDLSAINPRLIMLSTCLNGQTGPEAMVAGFGTMGAALSGFHEITGWPDRPPAGPFVAYTDYIAPRFIAIGLLAALEHRRRSGVGQQIDMSQVEAAVPFLGPALLDYTVNGRVLTRRGNDSDEHAPHGAYPCAGEGRWLAVACGSEAQWRALCGVLGHPEWAEDARFVNLASRQANRAALDEAIGAETAGRAVEELEAALQAVGVPAHRATNSADALADPQLAHRGHFVHVEHPELGRVAVEGSRLLLSRTPAAVSGHAPLMGEHNERVLRDILGMSEGDVVELVAAGALE